MMIRKAQFADRFYPANKTQLIEEIRNSFLSNIGPSELPSANREKKDICALIVPHAGYLYSGPIAAWAYLEAGKSDKPQTIVIIGPNHSGKGAPISIFPQGYWETPLGRIAVNKELSENLSGQGFSLDEEGHRYEHSIEVQLPFLQFIYGSNFDIVCISMLDQSLETTINLAEKISKSIEEKNVLLISSSDFSHYEPEKQAREKDLKLIHALQKADLESIYRTADSLKITACGLGPTAAAIKACALIGAKKVNLLKYDTSAAITGDASSVVGYAALSIEGKG